MAMPRPKTSSTSSPQHNTRTPSQPSSSHQTMITANRLSNVVPNDFKEQNVFQTNQLRENLPTKKQWADGCAVKIVDINYANKHELHLNEDALEEILKNVQDMPVVVISIAGAFRTGKSFLLSFMLRCLQAKYKNIWTGDEDNMPLTGFDWGGGSKKVTTGIHLWSEPFIVRTEDNEEVAILLMDTQGTFEVGSPFKDSVSVFCLSTFLSSVQIFNISKQIQENNIEELQYFAKYGEFLRERSINAKPYQKLLFLIRDWIYPDEHAFGEEGGETYLSDVFDVTDLSKEQQQIRETIWSCFEIVSCFLMPKPGEEVEGNRNTKGEGLLTDMDPVFKKQLLDLVPSLFDPANLIVKKVGGRTMTGRSWCQMFKTYIKHFKENKLPEPTTLFHDTVLANTQYVKSNVLNWYDEEMQRFITQVWSNSEVMNSMNFSNRKQAIIMYQQSTFLEKGDIYLRTLKELYEELEKRFIHYGVIILRIKEKEDKEERAAVLKREAEKQAFLRNQEELRKQSEGSDTYKTAALTVGAGLVVGAAAYAASFLPGAIAKFWGDKPTEKINHREKRSSKRRAKK